MAVTDDLLIKISADTSGMAKSVGDLSKQLDSLNKTVNTTSGSLQGMAAKGTKAVTDFGFANVKFAATLQTIEKAARFAEKALRLAFGEDVVKKAGEEIVKTVAEVGAAINEGLQFDVGQGIVDGIKDVREAFMSIRPTVVEAIANVKEFGAAAIDAFTAVNWEVLGKALAAIAAGVAVAFAPQIVAAVASFAAGLAAAVAPALLLAAKVVIIAAGLAAFAAAIDIAVRNMERFKILIGAGVLKVLSELKEAAANMGIEVVRVLTTLIVKAAEVFPAFAGVGAAAVEKLNAGLEAFGVTAKEIDLLAQMSAADANYSVQCRQASLVCIPT